MTADAATLVLAGGSATALALAFASAISWQSARSARAQRLRRDIDASRAHMDGLRRRRAAGGITQADLDAQERSLAEGLLAPGSVNTTAETPPRPARTRGLAVTALAVAVLAGGLYAWLPRAGPPAIQGATAPMASTGAAGTASAASDATHGIHALSDPQL